MFRKFPKIFKTSFDAFEPKSFNFFCCTWNQELLQTTSMLEKWRMMHFYTNPSLIHSGNFSDSNIVWIGFVNWSGYKIYEFVKWVKDYVIFSRSDSILWSSEYRLLTAFKNCRVPHLWNLTHIHHIYYQIFHFWLKCQVFLA